MDVNSCETTRQVSLQSLIDTHRQPFVVIDGDFRVVAVNHAYCQSYAVQASAVVGRPCYEVSHHQPAPCFESGCDCPHASIFAGGNDCSCLHLHYDEQGGVHRVRFSAYPLRDADGGLLLGEVLDELSAHRPAPAARHLDMAGRSAPFLHALAQLDEAAGSDVPVLIEGETGTGKELAAKHIHLNSQRHDCPFMTLDCTVLTEPLFESEVFGHEHGAFTGTVGKKQGLFELVDGGTLFLDEIGELPLSLQAKLLRVLETGEYRRVGGRRTLHTRARIICATNRDLAADVRAGSFREDLYYRIACLHVQIPSLRSRLSDVQQLAQVLLDRASRSSGCAYELTPDAEAELQAYDYPGNVRELRNILNVAAARSPNGQIGAPAVVAVIAAARQRDPRTVQADTCPAALNRFPEDVPRTLEEVEAVHIGRLLTQHEGNRRKVAAALGFSERTLYRKLKRYRLN